jgi:ABC-2 type transport system ATP-binding protein
VTDHALVIDGVSKSFGPIRAVDDVTVKVPAGSIYGFLGPNGAGKTTLLRMVMGIFGPDEGRIGLLGGDGAADVKDRVGYMPEERGLYPQMTVTEVLRYLATLKGMSRQAAGSAIADWLRGVELHAWAQRKVHELSRGMQQRLQFVASVVHNPDLIVLDEPFSGLDPLNLDLVKDHLRRLREAGKTIVLSTHIMQQAEDLCDYVFLINRGRKVLDGTLQEVCRAEGPPAVIVQMEGDAGFIASLPMVAAVTEAGRELQVVLAEAADDQALLRALLDRGRVTSFRVKTPSLHEVFVHAVKADTTQSPDHRTP